MTNMIFSTVPLAAIIERLDSIEKSIKALAEQQSEEKLLSPRAALKVFDPPISRTSLHNWTRRGLLTKHYMGTQPYYKLSEILQAARSLKKYSRA